MECPHCGVSNAAENEFCSACGGVMREIEDPPAPKPISRPFRDPRRLTQWLRWLLVAVVGACIVSGVSEFAQLQLLHAMRDGGFTSEAEMMSAANANDLRETVIAIAAFIIIIGTMVVFGMWIHRMDSNIHALGAPDLRYTPGWAVGWYFVPVANLWKPYQAMSEIWRASRNPIGWQAEPVGGLLPWWWFWWLASTFVDDIAMRMSWRAEALEELIGVAPVNIVASVLDAVSAFVALLVVRRVQDFQAKAVDQSLGQVFA